MNPVVLHFTKTSGATTLASAQIARFVSKELNCPLIDSKDSLEGHLEGHLGADTVIAVNSPWAFCDFRPEAEAFILGKRLIWIRNDFAIDIPKPFRGYDHLFSTCDKGLRPQDAYVNLNQLTYRPAPHKGGGGLIYYGAFRPDRVKAFEKFLSPLGRNLTISTTAKSAPKFAAVAPWAKRATVMDDVPVRLAGFDSTIYLQDETSGKEYHSPANRFYEALAAGIAIFFEPSSAYGMKQAGFDIAPYIVQDGKELASRLSEAASIAASQASWNRPFVDELKAQFRQALGKVE